MPTGRYAPACRTRNASSNPYFPANSRPRGSKARRTADKTCRPTGGALASAPQARMPASPAGSKGPHNWAHSGAHDLLDFDVDEIVEAVDMLLDESPGLHHAQADDSMTSRKAGTARAYGRSCKKAGSSFHLSCRKNLRPDAIGEGCRRRCHDLNGRNRCLGPIPAVEARHQLIEVDTFAVHRIGRIRLNPYDAEDRLAHRT